MGVHQFRDATFELLSGIEAAPKHAFLFEKLGTQ